MYIHAVIARVSPYLQHGVALHSRTDYNNCILLSLQNHISKPETPNIYSACFLVAAHSTCSVLQLWQAAPG